MVRALVAADATSLSLYAKEPNSFMLGYPRNKLTVDSASRLALSGSMKKDYRSHNNANLAAILEAFDDDQVDSEHCCPGRKVLAECLNEKILPTAALLVDALAAGKHARPLSN